MFISTIAKRISPFFNTISISKFSSGSTFLDMVSRNIDKAGEVAGIRSDRLNFLKQPEYSLKFNIPYLTDAGLIEVVQAYRVQHKTHRLPTKGGTRFQLSIDIEEVQALACLMTIKNTLAGLPYGGGKGGIQVDPRTLSKTELVRLVTNYTTALYKKNSIGASVDVPGPDLGTGEKQMTLMKVAYQNLAGHKDINYAGVTTGKSIAHHGIRGRTEATGLGVYYAARKILNNQNWANKANVQVGLKGKKFIIQGFGNVGYWTSKFFCEEGAILCGVIEGDGSFVCHDGVDPDDVLSYKNEKKGITGYINSRQLNGTQFIDEAAMYEQCDILVPAAIELAIRKDNAELIKAKIIIEAANGPTSIAAEQILKSKGVAILPDVLCNVGGVTVSYFEWLKNLEHVRWGRLLRKWQEKSKKNFLEVVQKATDTDESKFTQASTKLLEGASQRDIVHAGLQEVMEEAADTILRIADEKNCDLRIASYVSALTRLNDFYTHRGIDI